MRSKRPAHRVVPAGSPRTPHGGRIPDSRRPTPPNSTGGVSELYGFHLGRRRSVDTDAVMADLPYLASAARKAAEALEYAGGLYRHFFGAVPSGQSARSRRLGPLAPPS